MDTIITIALVIAFVVGILAIIVFMIIGKATGVGSGFNVSIYKPKVPRWITFPRVVKILITFFILYFFWALGSQNRFFWQPQEHAARFQISRDGGKTYYIIPEIAPEYENKIVVTNALGLLFGANDPAVVYFEGAKLLKPRESKADGFSRRVMNFIFSQDHERPEKAFYGKVSDEDLNIASQIVLFTRGDELVFTERGEHIIWAKRPKLGNDPHLYFHLEKLKI